MISEIEIKNFKSIRDLVLKPGRVTVLIGENGSGKSNLLEAITFAAGAAANKLDGEYLFNRGMRVTEWEWMQSAFQAEEEIDPKLREMFFRVRSEELGDEVTYRVQPSFGEEDGRFSEWVVTPVKDVRDKSQEEREKILVGVLEKALENVVREASGKLLKELFPTTDELGVKLTSAVHSQVRGDGFSRVTGLKDFLIYAPENTILRMPPPEGAIQPIGARGEGLFRLLQSFTNTQFADRLSEIKERLRLFGWFEDFQPPDQMATMQARLQIRDRWLPQERSIFDQRSANEGFLYLLCYFAILMSWRTPSFFALDNVDTACNPKLCTEAMRQIVELAKKYDKQVICTTHNPAILDGLDLNDDEQRLYVVRRDSDGHTVVRRVRAPKPAPGENPVRLSEAFMRGILGGLPDHF